MYKRQVRDGAVQDDAQFALIYELDEGDDWKDGRFGLRPTRRSMTR